MNDQPEDAPLPDSLAGRLAHVRWIGGGSGTGKSSMARRLAAQFGLRVYSCDEAIAWHVPRLSPADAPLLQAFLGMTMDQRWTMRSPKEMLRTFPWFAGEGFRCVLDDLLALPREPITVVEGFRLLPRLVAPLLRHHGHAVWLAPTPPFRRMALERRGTLWDIPNKTSDPARALANLLARDSLFTEEMLRDATALGLRVLHVDGTLGEAALATLLARSFELDAPISPPNPLADTGRGSRSDSH